MNTKDIITGNANTAADQRKNRRDYDSATKCLAAYWQNVIDTCAEYGCALPRGSKTLFTATYRAAVRKECEAARHARSSRAAYAAADAITAYVTTPTPEGKATAQRACEALWAAHPNKATVALGWSMFADHPAHLWDGIKATIARDLRAVFATL